MLVACEKNIQGARTGVRPGPCLVGSESHRSVGLAPGSGCHPQLSLSATQPGWPPLGDGDSDL